MIFKKKKTWLVAAKLLGFKVTYRKSFKVFFAMSVDYSYGGWNSRLHEGVLFTREQNDDWCRWYYANWSKDEQRQKRRKQR